jgi:DNA-binding MarR family transcriptional regulator
MTELVPPGFQPEIHEVMAAWMKLQATAALQASARFGTLDLTMAQFRALTQLRNVGRMSSGQLAAVLQVTPPTIVPMIDRLEAKGLVRRVNDKADRRLSWLELTPEGQSTFGALFAPVAQKVAQAFGQFSPEERELLKHLLEQISAQLDQA